MGHTTTTTTISVPLEVGYVCSKCGTTNLQTSIVKEWADSFRHGTIHTKSTYEKMSEESREGAEYRIGRRIDKIVDEAEINRFRKAELKCKCNAIFEIMESRSSFGSRIPLRRNAFSNSS